MSFPWCTFLLIAASLLVSLAAAQDVTFQWSFANISESNAFAPCQTVSLSVNGSSAQPPFYMVAYEREGTTTVSPVGSDPSQLTWQVDHRSGSTLALGLVDSAGNSGGVSPSTWSVQDDRSSSSSACLPSPSASAPTFSANVTGHLSTCQPLEILVQGGAPPYTVTIAQQGAGVINATLRPDEDMYTFINRATPGSTLLVAATDASGHWASRTLSMTTVGSTDTSCPGLVSSAGSIAALANAGTSHPSKPNLALIIGVCLAVVVAVLFFCLSLFWLVLRQRRQNQRASRGPDDEATLVASIVTPMKFRMLKTTPKLSLDLAEADADVYPSHKGAKPSPSDTASSSNDGTDVLDISPENRPGPASRDLPSPAPAAPNRQSSRRGRDYTAPAPLEPYTPSRPRHHPPSIIQTPPTPLAGPSNPTSPTTTPTTNPTYSLRPLPAPPALHAHFSPPSASYSSSSSSSSSSSTKSHPPMSLRNVRSTGDFRAARRSRPTNRARSLMYIRSAGVVFQHHDSELVGAGPSVSGVAHELPPTYDEVLRCSTPPVSSSSSSPPHRYAHSHSYSR